MRDWEVAAGTLPATIYSRQGDFFAGEGTNLGHNCLHCYAYRKIVAVKIVFVRFLEGAKNKLGEGQLAQTPKATCLSCSG